VDDTVDALLLAATSDSAGNQIFNIGGDCVINLEDLAKALVEANGSGEFVLREFPADRKRIDIGDYYADDSLIRETLGWEPKVPLREGLARTVAFYREHLQHYV
jgi:UDP-glucose 4-epimerase